MANTDGAIGMALGKLFVDKVFDETSKQQVHSYTLAVFLSNNIHEKNYTLWLAENKCGFFYVTYSVECKAVTQVQTTDRAPTAKIL